MKNEGKKYDLIANEFDQDRNKSLREKKFLDLFVTFLSADAHILDIGCGMAEPIAKYLIEKGFNVTGIDSSNALLEMAKKRFPKMTWLYGDMREIQLQENYDGLIAYDSFFHLTISDQIKMIERFSNWLKPNGIILLTTGPEEGEVIDAPMHGHLFSYFSMSPESYIKYFNENNLAVYLCEEDQPNHLVWILKKL